MRHSDNFWANYYQNCGNNKAVQDTEGKHGKIRTISKGEVSGGSSLLFRVLPKMKREPLSYNTSIH